ncbi:MAG: hypothetical protein ACJ75T_06595 [Solirubrobacterales bacterium]
MNDLNRYSRFWAEVGVLLMHPTQLLIIEALWHVSQPLSPKLLEAISNGETELNNFAYHCRRLTKLGILEPVREDPVRGVTEHFYDFATHWALDSSDG